MTDGDSEDLEQTRVHFDALRLELAKGTNDWKLPVVVRSYDPGDDGHEDYEDEAMLFEEHGYDRSFVQEEAALTATYRKTTGRVGSPAISEAAFCPKCGAARPDGAAFCPKCGAHYEQPAPAIARSSSKTPILVLALVFTVAAIGVGAFLFIKQSSVSDAASVWCTSNGDAVIAAGRHLGVFPPDALPVSIGKAVFTVKGLRSIGVSNADIDKVLSGGSSVISDWQTADPGSFARACSAAFDAR